MHHGIVVFIGLLLGRINPWFMLIVSKFVGGAFTILAPWSRHVASLTFCFIPTGFANGFFDAGEYAVYFFSKYT